MIHGLFLKSRKSEWLKIAKYHAHTKILDGPEVSILAQSIWIAGSGNKNALATASATTAVGSKNPQKIRDCTYQSVESSRILVPRVSRETSNFRKSPFEVGKISHFRMPSL